LGEFSTTAKPQIQALQNIELSTMAQSGPNSGGDLFDMAEKGTTVPEDSAKPRYIPSKPRPDQIASESDPNDLGATNLEEAADNAVDIPRVSLPQTQKIITNRL